MSFETKAVTLTVPLDLALDDDVGVARLNDAIWVGIQNTGVSRVYWRETAAAPDASARGHFLAPGAAIVVLVIDGRAFWLWSAAGDGEVTITPAAAVPTRRA